MKKYKKTPLRTRQNIAVLVDGECEEWYLQMLKRTERQIKVNLKPEIPQKKKLSDQFRLILELAENYTKVFWIVDFDTIISNSQTANGKNKKPIEEFYEFENKLRRENPNVIIIINNPCLEYWFLLHFEFTIKEFANCNEVKRKLKKYILDYDKTKKYFTQVNNDIYLKLKPFQNTALINAQKIASLNENDSFKSISGMYLFFKEIFNNQDYM